MAIKHQMRYLVVIPTYNEKENITRLIPEVLKQNSQIDILVVDDNSPDGTSLLVKDLKLSSRVSILDRPRKSGLGTAYRDGLGWGLKHKYDYLISMDADFSHSPKALKQMIKLSQENPKDILVGSRYVAGGKITGWNFKRYLNSYSANFIVRLMLGLRPHDASSGFKLYPAGFIKSLDFAKLTASGYAFQAEMIYYAQNNGFGGLEFPITFAERRLGQSKIAGEIKKSIKVVMKLFLAQTWVKQFIRFCVVGTTCAALDWGIYFLIKHFTSWDSQSLKQVMKALSFVFSASSSYILNRLWTFKSRDMNIGAQAIKFFAVAAVGLGLNNLFFYLFTGIFKLADIIGLILATFLVLFWNFAASRKWVFNKVEL